LTKSCFKFESSEAHTEEQVNFRQLAQYDKYFKREYPNATTEERIQLVTALSAAIPLLAFVAGTSDEERTKRTDFLPRVSLDELKTEILSRASSTILALPSPDVEVEMVIKYPLNLLSRILPLLAEVHEQLDRLGDDGGPFSFGYDVLPAEAVLDDPADDDIFTGMFSKC
jgi:hypothetical protein